jgi:dihydropteroate synthase
VDPGIGFGKNLSHNLELIRRLREFQGIAAGVLLGPSRKSFIGTLTGKPVEERLPGSIAAVVAGAMAGAEIVRVHDVRPVVEALKVADAIRMAGAR